MSILASPPPDASATVRGLVNTGPQEVAGGKRGQVVTLSIVSNETTTDLSLGNFFHLDVDNNTEMKLPINIEAGQSGCIVFENDGAGWTVTFETGWYFPDGTAPTFSNIDGAINVVSYFVDRTGRVLATSAGPFVSL